MNIKKLTKSNTNDNFSAEYRCPRCDKLLAVGRIQLGSVTIICHRAKCKLKVIVKRLLRQYGYPPDKQKLATENVLKQAELLADDWAREVA